MSGTTVTPPPPPPVAVRALSAYGLPAHALRILGSCGLSLVLWFSAGRAVRAALMLMGSELSHGDHRQVRLVITMFVFTLIVLNELVVMVGMLHSARGALREIQARREDGEADESMLGALNRATLVFATIYLAWSFHNQDAQEFIALDFNRQIDADAAVLAGGGAPEGGTGLVGLDPWVSLGVAVAAYLLKALFGWWYANGKVRGSGVLTTFFELAFAFYSLNALFVFTTARADWLEHRVAVAAVADWLERVSDAVPWWKDFWKAVGEVWPYFSDGLILPLVWLTVASLVYGAFAEDTRAVVRGTRLDTVADRMERTHSLTRNTVTQATGGFQERWVPPANAFRLTTRGGAALFGMFCLCYVAIRVATDYATRGVQMLIGSEQPFGWVVIGGPVEFVGDLVIMVLTVAVLAATFDIAATRSRVAGETLTA
ncbi:hypothetical protein [Streptosporangium lutulentum]|uniref:Uncharacterized protein n=1 Tax=Streptosporangium lutulentum TaxID=1461250 RepID=A0ABT9QJM8_9ACTN|nr:hypothetical protein [Streptosporangium lutulentum]MDP9846955.1 hypothetical protein [Streptosporangium lutulentum]